MNREDLEPYWIVETSLRGTHDLGWTFEKEGRLYCGFKNGDIYDVNGCWNKDLMVKSDNYFSSDIDFSKFIGDHIVRIRKPQFAWQTQRENFVHAPVIWSREKSRFNLDSDNAVIFRQKFHK